MRKTPHKTGDHGVGLLVHVIHMTDEVPRLNEFYESVFGGLVYMGVDEPTYSPVEDRWASLIMVGDLCVETMAPHLPVDSSKPVGRFFSRFGRHLHSVGYKVDDLAGLGTRLIQEGVRLSAPGGGGLERVGDDVKYLFPSPRDLGGLMVQLSELDMPGDPRSLESWSSQAKLWESSHPLGLRGLHSVIIGVRDVHGATELYTKLLQAAPASEGVEEALGYRYATLRLGDSQLQLAEPLDERSSLGKHVSEWGNMIYGLVLEVVDLNAAESWLGRKGIRTGRPRPGMLAADPDDCFGVPYFFQASPLL